MSPRQRTRMKKYQHLLTASLLLLAACALSPQIVPIQPDIQVTHPATDKGVLALEVTDTRSSNTLGKRGGVYGDTSDISTAGDITGGLRQSLVTALRKMGYEVLADPSSPALRVELATLGYRVIEDKVTRHIETRAAVNAVFNKENKTFTNTYTITRNKEMLAPPGEGENVQLINDTLAAALQQMLEDGDLFNLIDSTLQNSSK